MYTQPTRSVTITVRPEYLEDQSKPDENHYVWAYHIRIQNQGQQIVQLLTRYWKIVDCAGRTQEVRGPGVVGEQPVLRPGESFEYSSGTRSEEHTSELQSLMRISYAGFCLKKKNQHYRHSTITDTK